MALVTYELIGKNANNQNVASACGFNFQQSNAPVQGVFLKVSNMMIHLYLEK